MVFKHIDDVTVEAKFSKDKKFRYQLVITKNGVKEGKTVCVIMQNPSDANEEIADRSVKFLERLVFEKDIKLFTKTKKLIVVNQFGFIQKKDFVGIDEKIGNENDEYVMEAIKQTDIVVIAWGVTNDYYKRQEDIMKMILRLKKNAIYRTKKHPSRGTYLNYLEKL